MGVVDFSRKINTNVETTGFQSVVFGANGALLEVELNEMQALVNERLRKFLKSMFGDCCSQDALYVIDNNVFLNGTFIIDGYLFTNSDPIIVDISETNQLYLGYKIETITGADKVHKDGIGNEDEIDNTIIDTRVGIETSRREILSVKLVADGTSLPDDYNSFLLVDAGEPQIRSKNIDSVVTYCTEYVDKLVDSISTSIRNLTSKTDNLAEDVDEINSKLSNQLGNHTVKSDVPENAVFTDTVYDDTEVQKRISDNGYGEVAGGKNLLNPDKTIIGELSEGTVLSGEHYISDYISIKSDTSYSISNCTQDSNEIAWYTSDKTYISRSFGTPVISPSNASYVRIEYMDNINAQLEEGSVATEYEPYFPSNKMLAEKTTNLDNRISDNGYGELAGGKNLATVSSFSTQNNEIIFTKKDDSTLIANGSNCNAGAGLTKRFLAKAGITYTAQIITDLQLNMFIWNSDESSSVTSLTGDKKISFSVTKDTNISIAIDTNNVVFNNTEIKVQLEEGSVATSYEPYFPSNKMLAEEKADKSETTVNLLNTTLQTTTQNGVTCTNNGDGTYTLNGTSTSSSNTAFVMSFSNTFTGKCKLIGCPSGIDSIAELQCNYNGTWSSQNTDHGEGSILDNVNLLTNISIVILPNVTVNNIVFKPMITTNLDATYDDFVPYTGDTGKLNSDVANIKNDLYKLQDNVDSSDIQYSAYIKNANGDITPSAITSSPKINEVVSQINNNIGLLLQGHNEQKSKLDNISIYKIDIEPSEIMFKGINFAAELTLLKIGNQLELLRGKIYTMGSYFSVTSGDVLSFALSVSEFGDYINGLKETSKLAFSAQGIFDSKVIGMVEIGDYISSSGDKGVNVMLRFNDSYEFSSANVRSGTVQFNF